MKRILAIALLCISTGVFAQGLSIGVGAIAGSYSASAGVAAIGLTGPGTADASLVATNQGTGNSSVSAGFQIVPLVPIPLAATSIGTSQNTTTITPVINLPAGGTGFAGGAGVGGTFAFSGVQGFVVTVGPIPIISPLLPLPPILGPLPAIP